LAPYTKHRKAYLKPLKIKDLLDVSKALKIKDFQLPKSHRKATEKPQTVENQALEKFLFGFSVCRKDISPRPHPHPLARFLQAKPSFFLYISVIQKN
jgi:hypothetical protein